MANKHEIKTINDLAKLAATLTPNKCSNLIRDFSNFIANMGGIGAVLRVENKPIPKTLIENFVWIDDDKHNATIRVKDKRDVK